LKRNTLIFVVAFLCTSHFAVGRNNVLPVGAKAAAMGNAFVSQYDTWAVSHNQAGLAKIDKPSAGIYYENRFLVPELSLRAATVTYPTSSGNFTGILSVFGPNSWKETDAAVAFSKLLGTKLSAGIQFNYFAQRLPELNQNISTVSFEIGAIYQLRKNTAVGLHVANPYSPPMKTLSTETTIPWRVEFGGSTSFLNKFLLAYEIEKRQSEDLIIKVGASWEAVDDFTFRCGVNSVSRFSAGFGFRAQIFEVDIAVTYHQFLGYSPSASIIFKLP
jgi:hypothetical protein